MKVVYLCGPIHGKTDEECKAWREEAKRLLAGRFEVRDPLDRDCRGREGLLAGKIVKDDLADIRHAGCLLVNVAVPGWGTAMEVRYAYTLGLWIVGFGSPESPSPWLVYHCDDLHETLEDAVAELIADFGEDAPLSRPKRS